MRRPQMSTGKAVELKINEKRFQETLLRSNQIGAGPMGGLKRLALTDADKAMRDQFVDWCKESGLSVRIDKAGNIFGRLAGAEDLPPVVMGSHLDTVAAGGCYDGIVGVLAGLEIIRTVADCGITPKRPLEVVDWTNEEGARFAPPFCGSSVYAGHHSLEWLYALKDDDGLLFEDELRRIGYLGEAPINPGPMDSYFELHIEQGPELYEADVPIGLVTGSYLSHGMTILFSGDTAHVGPTPMAKRRNALVAAGRFITAMDDIGWRYAPIGKATSSRILAWPNTNGTIPDNAELTVDMRHQDHEISQKMFNEAGEALKACAEKARVGFEIKDSWIFGEKNDFNPELLRLVREAAAGLNAPTMEIYSQAGHDAYMISAIAPTVIMFCPCDEGISHNIREHAHPDKMNLAANVLLSAVLKRAQR